MTLTMMTLSAEHLPRGESAEDSVVQVDQESMAPRVRARPRTWHSTSSCGIQGRAMRTSLLQSSSPTLSLRASKRTNMIVSSRASASRSAAALAIAAGRNRATRKTQRVGTSPHAEA